MAYSLSKFAEITKSELFGKGLDTITDIIIDSRTISDYHNSVFIAIVGKRHNGHKYIENLHKKGVRNFIVSELPDNIQKYNQSNFLLVADTIIALHKIIEFHRNTFDIPVIGITGSNGKTIIKEWLFDLLKSDYNLVRSPKSFNSQIGVPLSVWQLNKNTELAIFEAGISEPSEMNKLQKLIQPNIGIFSNIGEAHQENFIDYKHKISEKLKLFTDSDLVVYCKDYQLVDIQIKTEKEFDYENKLFTWSKKTNADLQIKNIEKSSNTTKLIAVYKTKEISITIPFTDEASIENAINAWCLLLILKIDNQDIANRMKVLHPVAMRMELKDGVNNCLIINDYYNSDLSSLEIAIDFLYQQNKNTKKTLILSDIVQSGKNDNALYSEISELVRKKQINRFIGIGDIISNYTDKFADNSEFYNTTDDFISNFNKANFKKEDILLKGARKFQFELISNVLQEKVHETIFEINLSALVDNLNYYKSLLKPNIKLMVMVKAFSYGSGMYEIAKTIQYHRADYLAVAYPDEGVELRKAGIDLPIMVMNADERSFEILIDYQLEPEIYNFRILKAYHKVVRKNGLVSAPVHIKIDTGMKRLGFEIEEIDELISELKKRPAIKVNSIFSHLASSEDENCDDFTNAQINNLKQISDKIKMELNINTLVHILNSNGIERFKNAQFDMVRLGIGLYGFGTNMNKLQYVNSLKTTITQIKTVSKNETVGYNRKGKLEKDSKIAIIPIGYADGMNRALSNGVGKVLINGKLVNVIGNICMDMTMVDITNINAKEGDEVIIFNKSYPIEKIAKQLGTIPYEILTSISQRVKRVYIQE